MKNTIIAAVVMVGAACAGNTQSRPVDGPVITGSWVLNERDSQNPLTLIGGGAGGFGRGGGGDGGRGTGGGTGGGTIGGGGGGGAGGIGTGRDAGGVGGRSGGRNEGQIAIARAKVHAAEEKLGVLSDMHRRITIKDQGDAMTFAYAIGPQMSYSTRGKAAPDTVPVLGVVKSHAEWKDGQFLLKQKIGDLDVKEEFTRNVGSKRLFVYTTVKGLARPLQYRRVYDQQ